jgi:hypothetical protein
MQMKKPNKKDTIEHMEERHDTSVSHNPIIKIATIGRCAIRNRGKVITPHMREQSVRVDEPIPSRSLHVQKSGGHGAHSPPSSPSARLFERISSSLKDGSSDDDARGIHYCDIVDGSVYNQRPDCIDMDCWRHGNFSPCDPTKSTMGHMHVTK